VDVFRFALHLTGRREDAEDVVQHTFLQAHRHLDAGGELVNPRAWLMTTVKHRSFNLLRDRREIPVDQVLSTEPSPGAARDAAIELASVRALLWTLPENQHHAFVLRHWSGLSQNEIAEVLETTPSAVESLLVRARATLVAEHAGASAECEGVRRRLVEAVSLGDTHAAHVQTCGRCRTAQTRLKRTAELASVLALVPGTHVAHALAGLVPGFSAQAATASTAVAGSTATAGTAAGGGATSAIGSATAVSTAGKAALGAKAAIALVATTAAVLVTHPAAPHSIATAFFRHFGHPPAARRHLGSATVDTRNAMGELVVDNVFAALDGERPPTLLNPDVLA
jgi:RNA polymerase sigma-70 factor (ECF subfamily)